ncbi:MAG TPA: flagellar hook-length control protein FliK [Pilimelia sp.]|nr:flagellar hook-length control protein FliK [Pilimelia sp.]
MHRLTVHLHPADLGPVSVVAEIRDGAIHVQLAGATDAGRESLRAALPDLRRELTDSGFTDCQLDLRSGTGQGGTAQQFTPPAGWSRGDEAAPAAADTTAAARPATVLGGGRVDVQV